MPSLDDVLAALFASLGPIGSLLALLMIFAVDAALFPALPEAWILITYTFRPETMEAVGWAAVLLLVAEAGGLLGAIIPIPPCVPGPEPGPRRPPRGRAGAVRTTRRLGRYGVQRGPRKRVV